jgi:D-alanyl-D-alanine carboxypeptidase (penicillin-binding protein 5/6)
MPRVIAAALGAAFALALALRAETIPAAAVAAAAGAQVPAPAPSGQSSTPEPVGSGAPVNAFPGAAASYLVIADGAPLWATEAHRRLPPASLTKLMTALLVVDEARVDAIVTVGAAATRAGGARMGLAQGTRIRVSELLAGLMLRSANDACLALAQHVAGSETAFVARMNARAQALGLADTRFANACGFDAPNHHSSASDLARLAQLAIDTPQLARLMAANRHVARTVEGRALVLENTNVLLGLVPGLAGVKTGYTERAGHCLIGYAVRDGRGVLVVLLRAKDRWWDAVAMIEQAFERIRARPPRQSRG